MPMDAICLSGVLGEIRTAALGGKVDKIYQPGRAEVVLILRGPGGNVRLLLSADPGHPRPQLTAAARENPDKPPMFCMLLRKHLAGARLLEITQPPLERLADFRFEALDELGDRVQRRLVLECIGRRANLILLDGEGRILDCIRRADGGIAGRLPSGEEAAALRILQPGMFYRLPPAQDKRSPLEADRAELERLLSAAPEEAQADRWLLDTFGGLSPLVCRELAFRAGGQTDVRLHRLGEAGRVRLLDGLSGLMDDVRAGRLEPWLIRREGKAADYTFFPVGQYQGLAQVERAESFGALLDDFYARRETEERVRRLGQDMLRAVTSARDRTARKLALQEKELAATRDRERLRRLGDILTSNLHAMTKGMVRVRCVDFYDPDGGETDIPLDPLLTPQQNAARYYKEYNKAKTAERMLTVQLEKGRRELDYLNSVLESIALAEGERDLGEIRQELTETGYLRRPAKAKGREKRTVSRPMEFRSTSGMRISVGKNNTQNDLLTCKMAFKSDIWLHTRKVHGSHVILWTEGGAPDARSLSEAASLAAWFSQGRDSGRVEVDYTPVKYVKKPAGARPGMVVYTTYETALAAPDGDLAKRLRVK